MQISQDKANNVLVMIGWVFVIVPALCMSVCLWLWHSNAISDRVMIGLTLALSWLAIVQAGAMILLQAYTKRDIDS